MARITDQSRSDQNSIYSGTHDFRGEFSMCAQNGGDWQAGWQMLGIEPPADLPQGMMGIFYAVSAFGEQIEIRLPEISTGDSGTHLYWERYHIPSEAKSISRAFMAVILPLDSKQSQTFDDIYREWRVPRPSG